MAILVTLAFAGGLTCFSAIAVSTCQPRVSSKGQEQSSVIRRKGRADVALTTLALRGDVGSSDALRAGVDRGAADLERVSCGLAKASVSWDYSRERDLPLVLLRGDSVVMGLTGEEAERSLGKDEAKDLLGMTRSMRVPPNEPSLIFLITDRLDSDEQLTEWTALHEIGHALGMTHVKHGVMEPRAPLFFGLEDRPEWSEEDRVEFCRLYRCDATAIARCSITR